MLTSRSTSKNSKTERERGFYLSVREMQIADLDKVVELEDKSFHEPWSAESLMKELLEKQFSFCYVLEKEGKVIGYVIYHRIHDEADLIKIAIAPHLRKRGLGEILLNRSLQEIKKGVEMVYLEVRRSNLAAQNLYLKKDFRIDGQRKNYYAHDGEDAILMSLSLKEG